ncbi:MAG: translation initiation factor eIF-2B [Candidatus Odinarchaeia archaeon]
MEIIFEAAKDIKELKVQGATNVAISALEATKKFLSTQKITSKNELLSYLNEIKSILFNARSTEPAMQNGLRYLIFKVEKSQSSDVSELVELAIKSAEEFITLLKSAKTKIAKIGAKRILDNMTVMTHCHSSVVTGILKEAWNQGKRFDVVCTETRPRYQGRITAKELVDFGIPVTMVVDSAMRWAIRAKEIDLVIVGADAITSEGVVINKVGTRLLALAAHEFSVPFYVATSILKFNPETVAGNLEKIEFRDPKEIWETPPKGLKIENPAFETVAREYINGFITEDGIFPPSFAMGWAYQRYPYIFTY